MHAQEVFLKLGQLSCNLDACWLKENTSQDQEKSRYLWFKAVVVEGK